MWYRFFPNTAILLLATLPAWASHPAAADPEQPTPLLTQPSPLADYRRYREAPPQEWPAAHAALAPSATPAGTSRSAHTSAHSKGAHPQQKSGEDDHSHPAHHH